MFTLAFASLKLPLLHFLISLVLEWSAMFVADAFKRVNELTPCGSLSLLCTTPLHFIPSHQM